jgi:hypothetical protein
MSKGQKKKLQFGVRHQNGSKANQRIKMVQKQIKE